jgi:MFS family permease
MMGLITSTRNLSSNLLQILWGELSDRKGKRLFIFLGFFVNCFIIFGFLLFKDPVAYLFLGILFSIFWSMTIPAWNSLLGDYSGITTRGSIFGSINTIVQISNVMAMIIVALMTYRLKGDVQTSSFIIPFGLSAITSIACAILTIFAREKETRKESRRFQIFSGYRNKQFRRFLTASLLHNFAMSFAWPLFPYVTVTIAKAKVWQIAIIGMAGNLSSSLTQKLFGRLIDRIGRRPLIILGRMSLFTFPFAYSFAKNWIHLLIIHILIFAFTNMVWMVEPIYIIDQAPEGQRGLYLASNSAVAGIGSFIGSISGGTITQYLLNSMILEQAISTGLLISSGLRIIMAFSYLRIKETFKKD